MNRAHVEYQMLCAFAAVGELSEEEANDLSEHTESCLSCHRRLAEMETASWAYFLRHAGAAKGVNTPAGMQQRFEKRVLSVGFPMRDTTPALLGTRLISVALSVVLLTVFAQMGWKVLYPRMLEPVAVHPETTSIEPIKMATAAPRQVIGDPPPQKPVESGLKRTRNTTRLRSTGSYAPPQRGTGKGHSYSVLYKSALLQQRGPDAFGGAPTVLTSEVVGDYLTSGLRLPARRTFELTSAPRFLADGEYSSPNKHAFRYTPTVASLSFLGTPERVELPRLPVLNEPPPLFRMNSTKAW